MHFYSGRRHLVEDTARNRNSIHRVSITMNHTLKPVRAFFVAAFLLLAIGPALALTWSESKLPKDEQGLFINDWFYDTNNNLAEDMATAKAMNKRLVLVFEQKNCEFCRKLHEKLLSDADIESYLKSNFMLVRYNLDGTDSVTDLDGETLTENEASRKWKIRASPSYLFLPVDADGSESAYDVASAITSGTPDKPIFMNLFRWVESNVYHDNGESFKSFNKRMIKQDG